MTRRRSRSPPPRTRLEEKAAAIAACRDAAGRISPTEVWKKAKADPNHPLHREFNWNVEEAAMECWEARSRELIREVKFLLTYEGRIIAAPFYVSDPRTDESRYIASTRIARSGSASRRVLQAEIERIRAAVHRARALALVFNLESHFDRMLDQLTSAETSLGGDDDSEDAGASA